MGSSYMSLPVRFFASSSLSKDQIHPRKSNLSSSSSSSSSTAILTKKLQQHHHHHHLPFRVDILQNLKNAFIKLVDVLVESMFEFSDQTLLPSQSNFAPVEELGAPVAVTGIEGSVPEEFPEGIYLRNGSNPLFGGLKSARSVFGKSNHIWVEGEGMLHALHFSKDHRGTWSVIYSNRFVQTETFKLEKLIENRPSFLPAAEGDSLAVLAAYALNLLRYGKANKDLSNTAVFEHSGKLYSIAETHVPQEIDPRTLQTLGSWDANEAWNRPAFSSHPKKAPGTGELVVMGITVTKPFMVLGVISEDGKELVHKVDVKLARCCLSHEIGVTERHNVILDYPLTIDVTRLIRGGPLIQYNKEDYARIGVMPRYGDANSIHWFEVAPNCTLHLFNCFEDGDEVVVWGCRAVDSIIPGPEKGRNKFEWFSRRFKPLLSTDEQNTPNVADSSDVEDGLLFSRAYEWRLNLKTGEVRERYLNGTQFSMDFPTINSRFTGLKNKFGYAQVLNSWASSNSGMLKFGGLAKLHFEEPQSSELSLPKKGQDELIKVEYHMFEENCFCSGASFVCKEEAPEEDDGWMICHVHNEITNTSQVYIIDTKKFSSKPVAKIRLPHRVPYGFHGAFMSMSWKN